MTKGNQELHATKVTNHMILKLANEPGLSGGIDIVIKVLGSGKAPMQAEGGNFRLGTKSLDTTLLSHHQPIRKPPMHSGR